MSLSIETLASYVPSLVVRRFAINPSPLTSSTIERFPAAALFADISGYTALAERLAQHGSAGAEKLPRLLNAYFSQLIDIVIPHGGDIIKFAGDAALILWPAIDESLATATHRAAQCGLAMQEALCQYELADGLRLSLRVGIGAGDVVTANVGGVFNRWEFMVMGEPIIQTIFAEHQAQPGQVVLSPEAWSLVQDRYKGTCIKQNGNISGMLIEMLCSPLQLRRLTAIIPPYGSEAALRSYIPAAVMSRLIAGQAEWVSELRRVTVLFLNVRGMDYSAADVVDRMHTVMRTLQTTLYHYEGSVNQFMVDDKGTTLVAAFGLPPLTHEDDAVRGVKAALALQSKLHDMGLRSAIGITTGQAYCGERGNGIRREYAIVGSIVNMAARLMQAASKYSGSAIPVLCDKTTYHASQSHLLFDTLEPINVKGKAEPVAVYRPHSTVNRSEKLLSSAHPQTDVIGRAEELDMLSERLHNMIDPSDPSLDNSGGLVIIEGEAGIGKSCLVNDLLRQSRSMNVSYLIGAGDAIEKSTPYYAWKSIFSQILSIPQIRDEYEIHTWQEVQRSRVIEYLQSSPELLPLTPLINAVLHLNFPDNEATKEMDGQARADNTQDFLARLLQRAVGKTPVLLVLEDAHWMDSSSWMLSRAVSQQASNLMMLIVIRPFTGLPPKEYNQLLSSADCKLMLKLKPLSPENTLMLIRRHLGVTVLPGRAAALIHEKAQGNPFFIIEMTSALRDAGLILISDGECNIASGIGNIHDLSLPHTLQGIINSRIDKLTAVQQLVLKVASVIGRIFTLRILHDVYPIENDKAHILEHLVSLQQMDIISIAAVSNELAYTFKNTAIQEAAYSLILFSQKSQIHRAVAEWYERAYANDLSLFYPLLAHHFSNAVAEGHDDPVLASKAISYLEKAGEQALHNYANYEAVRFLKEAVKLDDSQSFKPSLKLKSSADNKRIFQSARRERQLGEAYLNLGYLSESREHIEKALSLMKKIVPKTKSRLTANLIRQISVQAFHRLGIRRLMATADSLILRQDKGRKSEALREKEAHLLESARSYLLLGQVCFYTNERALNIHANLSSLNMAEAAGPSPELARSYASVCIAAGLTGLHTAAKSYGRLALKTAQEVNYLPSLIWVLLITSVYDAGIGKWDNAAAKVKQAIKISNRHGDRRRWEQSMNTLATISCLQGKFAECRHIFDNIYESAFRRSDAQYQAYGLLGQAVCLLPGDKADEAASLLAKIESLLQGNIGRVVEIYFHGLNSLVRLRQGQHHLARQSADNAAQLISQSHPISYNLVYAYASVAETYLTLWEIEQSEHENRGSELDELSRQTCQSLHEFSQVFPIGQPSDWICQGLYNWLKGNKTAAYKAWRKAASAAKRLSMHYEHGRAHYEIGRHYIGFKSKKHLTQAREILAPLGAEYDLKLIQIAKDTRKS